MIKFTILALSITYAVLSFGYYTIPEEHDSTRVWFIKKHLTPQISFRNILADGYLEKKPQDFSEEEKEELINYCKYRWGVETKLEHLDEFTRCGEL